MHGLTKGGTPVRERSAGGFRDKVIDTLWSGRYPIDPRLTFQAAGKKCSQLFSKRGEHGIVSLFVLRPDCLMLLV